MAVAGRSAWTVDRVKRAGLSFVSAAILDPQATRIGIGVAEPTPGAFVVVKTQLFR